MSEALSVVGRDITTEMNQRLIRDVSNAEIRVAVFQLGSVKAPGPDGYPGFFYHPYWAAIGSDVCSVVWSFFTNGFMPPEWNHTNLVLILKVKAPETLSHFRPISLCNFTLKIITKILANRLKRVLCKLISPNQSAFVPGRMIQDNILVAHEAFHFLKMQKKGKQSHMVVKLDFNKAYDRVQWDFLQAIMQKMGFHGKWINWIICSA